MTSSLKSTIVSSSAVRGCRPASATYDPAAHHPSPQGHPLAHPRAHSPGDAHGVRPRVPPRVSAWGVAPPGRATVIGEPVNLDESWLLMSTLHRIYLARGLAAIGWAAGFAAVGGTLGAAAVTLLVLYPLIDVA